MLKINDITRLYLGIQGENESRTIQIDCRDWMTGHPNASFSIWHKRNGDTQPSATGASFDSETGVLEWTPTDVDTFVSGEGQAEIRMTESDVIKKTVTVVTGISPSLTGAGVPLGSDWASYIAEVDRIKSLAVEAQEAAEDAQEAAEDAKEDAEAARDAAREAQDAAEMAQGKAEDAQGAAETAQGAAETAQGKAEDAQEAAETAQNAAETAQGKAEDAQEDAEAARDAAREAQDAAETAQGKAEGAQEAAETAQGKAEDAQGAAETAQEAAETAQGKAEDAQGAAETAQEAAETAQGKAEDAQGAAEDARDAVIGMTVSASGLPAGSQPTVEFSQGNMHFGIPKGEPGDPTELIDDTAGEGDTDRVWSADKSYKEITDLKSALKSIGLGIENGTLVIDPVIEIGGNVA